MGLTLIEGKSDTQTVDSDGRRIVKLIDGVSYRPAVTQPDERGEICEIYAPAWGIHPDPLTYVYMASVRPGKIKGWVYHERQDDRMFIALGSMKVVLFDLRKDSPTSSMINEFPMTERNRGLLIIPKLVAHAVQNIGSGDAVFINMPTRPYDHRTPDKRRIPLGSPAIPYAFVADPGR